MEKGKLTKDIRKIQLSRSLDLAIKLDLSDSIKDFDVLEDCSGYEIVFKDTESLKTFTMFFGLTVNFLKPFPQNISCFGKTIQITD